MLLAASSQIAAKSRSSCFTDRSSAVLATRAIRRVVNLSSKHRRMAPRERRDRWSIAGSIIPPDPCARQREPCHLGECDGVPGPAWGVAAAKKPRCECSTQRGSRPLPARLRWLPWGRFGSRVFRNHHQVAAGQKNKPAGLGGRRTISKGKLLRIRLADSRWPSHRGTAERRMDPLRSPRLARSPLNGT